MAIPAAGGVPADPFALLLDNRARNAQSPADVLRNHYLDKHEKQVGPLNTLLKGAALIASVCAAVFVNMSSFPSFLIGLAVWGVLLGTITCLTNRFADNTNLEAAEALKAPGFYGQLQPRDLASAQNILRAYRAYCA